jgi:uncharacterized protein (DUF342 family)
MDEALRKAQQAVTLLKEIERQSGGDFAPQKREMLLRALRSQLHFQGQLGHLNNRKTVLTEELHLAQRGKVRALDMAYNGLKVTIGTQTYQVTDVMYRCSFYLNELNELTIGTA